MAVSVPAGTHPRTDAEPVLGRRERKKLATRAAVREAALRLSVRHGVENVTVEQIAAEADIALRTFFNHFSSKEDAVVAASAAGADALIAAFRARPRTESVLQALRGAVLVVMDDSDATSHDHLEALRLIRTAPSLVPHQLAILAAEEKALADAITERLGPGDSGPSAMSGHTPIYPMLCAATALAALRLVLDRWLDQATGPDTAPPLDALRGEIDQALAELAAGLDRPGIRAASDNP
ncbi:TetR/AcrR family transcriptional regulator [Pseudonocardia alaniniphila]|uniref:TetR/AcrR family transcriptional regulator n=1 Tax=Pseudonocardia alaniniphila TaxID=75291 RepID=A0ABS9TU66_9PSEU|nr:TetR/AcrR family transcriptional regulator [Pseudonocardia alaniniphila]MCH6172113.1 TetR/AcrR family transcriptional regulator [Pseudonocardia alaniniphila]